MTDQTLSMTSPSKMIEINWADIEPGIAAYANNLLALFDGKSVHLIFAQMTPPIIFGKNDAEKQERLNGISSVTPMPVARVVIPLEDFCAMLRLLQEQLVKIDSLVKP